jgi:hypothetical protein
MKGYLSAHDPPVVVPGRGTNRRTKVSWSGLAIFGAFLMIGGWLFLVATVNKMCGPADFSCGFQTDPILGTLAFLLGGACLAAGVFFWIDLSWTRDRGGGG